MKSKAIFLLVVFLLNTAVGFGCALHMSHSEDHEAHHDGHKHHHEHGSHHLAIKANLQANKVSIGDKDAPCCQGAVNNFISIAKQLPQTVKSDLAYPVADFVTNHYFSLKAFFSVASKQQIIVNQRQRPPTSDIRISIQSFQI